MSNVFACLVHERPDCVADLVANLRYLDPDSEILLYDGSAHGVLLADMPARDVKVHRHPRPSPMKWGTLHGFAVDCMRHALEHLDFRTMTIVDSDQLLLRPGYTARLNDFLAGTPEAGCLVSTAGPQPATTTIGPPQAAWAEVDLWRPFLRRFPDGEAKYPQWTFWPTTVFTREAARGILALWDDPEFADIMRHTRIWATEEVILPTLAALAGTTVVPSPFRYDCVQFRRRYSIAELEATSQREDGFWVHPVARRYDDPLRAWIRARNRGYGARARVPGRRRMPFTAGSPELVSCVMPTRDRRAHVPRAVDYFLRQDYAERELIVVDDGADAVADLLPDNPSIRYVRLAEPLPLSAKRDIGNAHARGAYLVHWDDDDWMAPWRLSYQVTALRSGEADVTGLQRLYVLDVERSASWLYRYPPDRRRWIADGSACYRREMWESRPFAAGTRDAGYHWAGTGPRLLAHGDPSFYVATIHPGNRHRTRIGGAWWRPVATDEIRKLLGDDWSRVSELGQQIGQPPQPEALVGVSAAALGAPFVDQSDRLGKAERWLP